MKVKKQKHPIQRMRTQLQIIQTQITQLSKNVSVRIAKSLTALAVVIVQMFVPVFNAVAEAISKQQVRMAKP